LTINELLREFERQFVQFFGIEKLIFELKNTKLFIQTANPLLQKKLKPWLKDWNEERGLKTNWKEIDSIVSLLTKKLTWRDQTIGSILFFHRFTKYVVYLFVL
jgi:hypothetical protein